jgi:hypothetical protein
MSAFMHSAVSFGTPDIPPPGVGSSHSSNITAQRYRSGGLYDFGRFFGGPTLGIPSGPLCRPHCRLPSVIRGLVGLPKRPRPCAPPAQRVVVVRRPPVRKARSKGSFTPVDLLDGLLSELLGHPLGKFRLLAQPFDLNLGRSLGDLGIDLADPAYVIRHDSSGVLGVPGRMLGGLAHPVMRFSGHY